MRRAFVAALSAIADTDERIMLLTGDLGYGILEPFAERHPDKYVNVGCSEQLMVGMATGLAKEGRIVFCYSIGNFALLRPYEFVRNGPVHHNLPVCLVGTGRADDYGAAGETHWMHGIYTATLAIGLPHIHPNTDEDVRKAVRRFIHRRKPCYLSLSRA
jgi:transketolase